jgi:alkylated DNA repair dioxygenase AlkB
MSKRTLHSFFAPPAKKTKVDVETSSTTKCSNIDLSLQSTSKHKSYPHPIQDLPEEIAAELETLVTAQGKVVDNQPHLDLLHFEPFIPRPTANAYFAFLRSQLPFYRVIYTITRFGKPTVINTPRYTTVFGIDDTSRFHADGSIFQTPSESVASGPALSAQDSSAQTRPVASNRYTCHPRPIPQCLDLLRRVTEAATDTTYNFCLVNYYASGTDSISFHSDDERFLGPDPAIASFSLGARRDFLMKHKPVPLSNGVNGSTTSGKEAGTPETMPIKMPLGSGDMVLMRGKTQANWLHSIPKRTAKGGEAERGRINITFRRARVPGGTENYYRYNVGNGPVYRWDQGRGEMILRADKSV